MGLFAPLSGLSWVFLNSSWGHLGPHWAHWQPTLSIFLQFFNIFRWPMLGFLGSSLGVCRHPCGPPEAILSLLVHCLEPACVQLWLCLSFFGAILGVLGVCWETSWARYGPEASLGSSLSVFDAMLCDLDVSLELFAHPWSLPCAIWGQIGIPRLLVASCAHLEAYLRVSELLHSSDAQ